MDLVNTTQQLLEMYANTQAYLLQHQIEYVEVILKPSLMTTKLCYLDMLIGHDALMIQTTVPVIHVRTAV